MPVEDDQSRDNVDNEQSGQDDVEQVEEQDVVNDENDATELVFIHTFDALITADS